MAFASDVLIVDNAPRGAMAALNTTLGYLNDKGTCRCFSNPRDVPDDPESVQREWHTRANEDAILPYYDAVQPVWRGRTSPVLAVPLQWIEAARRDRGWYSAPGCTGKLPPGPNKRLRADFDRRATICPTQERAGAHLGVRSTWDTPENRRNQAPWLGRVST